MLKNSNFQFKERGELKKPNLYSKCKYFQVVSNGVGKGVRYGFCFISGFHSFPWRHLTKVCVLAGWPYAYLTADAYSVNLGFLNIFYCLNLCDNKKYI